MTGDLERIRDALRFVPVGGHDERVRMAFAIKSEVGDAGFDSWNEWYGLRGDAYDAGEARSTWKSASAGGKVTAGTLFYEARANGWRDDGTYQKPTPEELAERKHMAAARAEQEKAEIAHERTDAARKATAIWKAGADPVNNSYLSRKRVVPTTTLREIDVEAAAAILGYQPKSGSDELAGRLLVVPVKQGDRLSTLELIDDSGRKSALAGRGTKTGGYWAAQTLPDTDGSEPLQVFEGVATALSGKESNGDLSVAALSAGNLLAVAKIMRKRYPTRPLVIGADLVKATGEANPHALEAARAVGGKLAIPDFGADRDPDMTDFNDMAQICGADAVANVIANASEPARGEHQADDGSAAAGEYARNVELIRASDVKPEAIAWLWNGWLAVGKMHVFGGAPGTGKTTISMGLAATVTTGGRWPDGTRSIAGNVVIWSGEDDPADTLIPRLTLSGADLSRTYFIADIREGNERRSFDPARDMEPLRRKLAEIGGVKLLIVDPVVSAIAGDSHKNAEVRRGLQPLVDLAGSMRCALLGITHFSKGTGGRDPVERLTGSLAFGALARVVLVAAKHQEQGDDGRTVRLFCRAKSNIGPDDGGFEYDLHQAELKMHPGVFASAVLWGDAVEGEARELLATADATDDPDERDALDDAKRFLRDLLAGGPVPSKQVDADIRGAGYAPRTINRAKKLVGATSYKEGKTWLWRINGATQSNQDCQPCQEILTRNVGNLGNVDPSRTVEVEI